MYNTIAAAVMIYLCIAGLISSIVALTDVEDFLDNVNGAQKTAVMFGLLWPVLIPLIGIMIVLATVVQGVLAAADWADRSRR